MELVSLFLDKVQNPHVLAMSKLAVSTLYQYPHVLAVSTLYGGRLFSEVAVLEVVVLEVAVSEVSSSRSLGRYQHVRF